MFRFFWEQKSCNSISLVIKKSFDSNFVSKVNSELKTLFVSCLLWNSWISFMKHIHEWPSHICKRIIKTYLFYKVRFPNVWVTISFMIIHIYKMCVKLLQHPGLRLNLNLRLFLQTFNAISGSEYVKIGSMCIFFLISVICLSENTTLFSFRVKFKSCFISIRQRLLFTMFVTIFCSWFP